MTSALPQQYIQIEIHDDYKYDIRVENANIESGQFYREDDRNDILTSDDVDDMVIRHNGGMRTVCSMYGSQGCIDLVDNVRDMRICSLAWRSSMEPGEPNEFKKLNHNSSYIVEIGKWNGTGTMGAVPVTIKEQS